jgi:hypothetical protein
MRLAYDGQPFGARPRDVTIASRILAELLMCPEKPSLASTTWGPGAGQSRVGDSQHAQPARRTTPGARRGPCKSVAGYHLAFPSSIPNLGQPCIRMWQ